MTQAAPSSSRRTVLTGFPLATDRETSLVIPREEGQHRHDLWLHQMIGQSMEPTIRNGDFVVVSRVDSFRYDGLYVVDSGFFEGEEAIEVCRCQSVGLAGIKVFHDHQAFREGYIVPRHRFNEIVRGIVAMVGQVYNRHALGMD